MHLVNNGVQYRKWGGNTYPGKRRLARLIHGVNPMAYSIGPIVRNFKKGKLKTKTMLKIIILDEQELSVQSSEQVWSWGNMYLPKPGKVAVTASISENK